MRNDKLRNELNDLPQEFDRERIWEEIDLPKKKRKRRGFWIFLLGISLIGAFILGSQTEKYRTKKLPLSQQPQIIDEAHQKHQTTSNATFEELPTEEQKNTLEKVDVEVTIENKIKPASSLIREGNIELADEITPQVKKNPSNSNEHIGQRGQLEVQDNQGENKNQALLYSELVAKEANISETNTNSKVEELEEIPANLSPDHVFRTPGQVSVLGLPTMFVSSSESIKIEFESPKPYQKIMPVRSNLFKLGIGSFVGLTSHVFKEEQIALDRENNEKGLESVGLSLFGNYGYNNVIFLAGVSYVRYNTNFTFTEEDQSFIYSLTGSSQETLSTSYSLFNAYEYVDVFIGLGYDFKVGNRWKISPSLQLNYTVAYDIDGDLFKSATWSEYRPSLSGYWNYTNWQSQFNLTVVRNLNEDWQLGLFGYTNTQKSLAVNDVFSHKVSAYGVGISLMRHIH